MNKINPHLAYFLRYSGITAVAATVMALVIPLPGHRLSIPFATIIAIAGFVLFYLSGKVLSNNLIFYATMGGLTTGFCGYMAYFAYRIKINGVNDPNPLVFLAFTLIGIAIFIFGYASPFHRD